VVASGALGGGGRVGWLRGHLEARTPADGLRDVPVVAVAAPFLVQALADQQASPRPGRGHHRGARRAGVTDPWLAVSTGQQGQDEPHPCDARAQATSRRQA